MPPTPAHQRTREALWQLLSPLVLASTSKYRMDQLTRLSLPFEAVAPDYEEDPVPGLTPAQTVDHHALHKCLAVQKQPRWTDRWILAADQGVILPGPTGDRLLGKPFTVERAVDQLLQMAGKTHELRTTVVLGLPGRAPLTSVCSAQVTVRSLTRDEALAYVLVDDPLDCAGSYRIERAGPWLFESLQTDDPTAIEGLPLVHVARLLRQARLSPA
jgi:septum formation protein